MALFDDVGTADVLSAIEEFDKLGSADFLGRYGYAAGDADVLWHDGRIYPGRAILGAARKFATGTPATAAELGRGVGGVRLLADLGFHVTPTDPFAPGTRPVTGSWRDAEVAGEAAGVWADAARDVLLQAARRFRAVVTQTELVTQVAYRTGVRADPADPVLAACLHLVALDCVRREEPLLPALCVDDSGRAGSWYPDLVVAARGVRPASTADHATQERVACYRHFRAVGLPAGGAVATPAGPRRPPRSPRSPKAAATRPPARQDRAAVATCPSCFMSLPVTGECDNCA